MNPNIFAEYPTGNLCNAHPGVRPLSPALRPLIPNVRVAGTARTARIVPGQNAAVHRAVHEARPGDLLVVDGAASCRFGPFGDLLAEFCRSRELAGAVFDCTVRDSTDIATLGFQVFCRGFHPEATVKTDPGEINIPVDISGVIVSPGDIVVGDNDGVVIIPGALAVEVLARVADVAEREESVRARIQAGESTIEIFGICH